jgi:hypothetical protein
MHALDEEMRAAYSEFCESLADKDKMNPLTFKAFSAAWDAAMNIAALAIQQSETLRASKDWRN